MRNLKQFISKLRQSRMNRADHREWSAEVTQGIYISSKGEQ